MIKLNIIPLKSVNGIAFGSKREEVRKSFSFFGEPTEFRKTPMSKNTSDDFEFCHIFYNAENEFEAIEIFDGEVIVNGQTIFPAMIEVAEICFSNIEKDGDYYTDIKSSVGLYAPNEKIESILFGCKDYYK